GQLEAHFLCELANFTVAILWIDQISFPCKNRRGHHLGSIETPILLTYSKLRPEHFDTQVCQPYVRHPVGRTIGAPGYQVATNESLLLQHEQMFEHVGVIRKLL